MTAYLDVDLGAFTRNLDAVRERTSPAQLMLVVKDDAYGHGVERIVQCASAQGVTWFGAFDAATGVRVRASAGDKARIFVWMLSGDASIRAAIDSNLDLGIGDTGLFDEVVAMATTLRRRARVHLKVDTGLHRNGVRPEDWSSFVRAAASAHLAGSVEVVGVWSHIAEASDDEDDAARALFEDAVAALVAAGVPQPLRHLAASAASFARAEFRYDLVRVGAFCYGIRSAGGPHERDLGLDVVATLRADVTAVGPEVTIDIGSADGVASTLAGAISVHTPGGLRELIAVERTSARVESWDEARVGEQVTLYGAGASSATDLGEVLDTIGEEIAVRVAPTVERRYI